MPLILLDTTITQLLSTASYSEVTTFLLCNCILVIGSHHYRLLEIEYYSLEDPYTHKDTSQYVPERWYWYRKGDTFKGVDITCRGGSFLLRAAQDLSTLQTIEVPSLLVDLILATTNIRTVEELR